MNKTFFLLPKHDQKILFFIFLENAWKLFSFDWIFFWFEIDVDDDLHKHATLYFRSYNTFAWHNAVVTCGALTVVLGLLSFIWAKVQVGKRLSSKWCVFYNATYRHRWSRECRLVRGDDHPRPPIQSQCMLCKQIHRHHTCFWECRAKFLSGAQPGSSYHISTNIARRWSLHDRQLMTFVETCGFRRRQRHPAILIWNNDAIT